MNPDHLGSFLGGTGQYVIPDTYDQLSHFLAPVSPILQVLPSYIPFRLVYKPLQNMFADLQ
jgi:hypothetical protein